MILGAVFLNWSGGRGSNPRHPAWEADALPLSYPRIVNMFTLGMIRQVTLIILLKHISNKLSKRNFFKYVFE